jgi:hypothetical protein
MLTAQQAYHLIIRKHLSDSRIHEIESIVEKAAQAEFYEVMIKYDDHREAKTIIDLFSAEPRNFRCTVFAQRSQVRLSWYHIQDV